MFFDRFFDFDDMGDPFFESSTRRSQSRPDNSRLYNILGVPKDATDSQIRKAFLLLAKKNHPDKGGDQSKVYFLVLFYLLVPGNQHGV